MVMQPFFCAEVLRSCFFIVVFSTSCHRFVIALSSVCHRFVIVSGVERLVRQCDQLVSRCLLTDFYIVLSLMLDVQFDNIDCIDIPVVRGSWFVVRLRYQ